MTTSTSNVPAEAAQLQPQTQNNLNSSPEKTDSTGAEKRLPQTLASSFIFLILGLGIVLSTLAYGTVHYWALAVFELGAASILVLWCADAWRTGLLRFSRNLLQLPLIGLIVLGLIQLLPLATVNIDLTALGGISPVKSLSLDPYSTRLVLLQVFSLLVYFAATLAFTDSPDRLKLLVRVIIVFGFGLAIFGLIQSFTSPTRIYWVRDLPQSMPFGPFVNRHHFAGYMEMTLALPLGLLFAGAVSYEKRFLYIFAAAVMGIALIMTNSRGGLISLVAEIAFLVIASGLGRRTRSESQREHGEPVKAKSGMVRGLLGLGLVIAIFIGVVLLGGETALNRFVGTVSSNDPTTGRAHFWSVSLDIIKEHPLLGAGLGAFGVVYTQHDSRNGLYRLEQAHNDYLQILTDGGLIGAILGLLFVAVLFRKGFARISSNDPFRGAVALGALAGCFAVLVHSFFDFTLHTTSNALLFLCMAALATLNGRVESTGHRRRHHHHRRHHRQHSHRVEHSAD
jgi:O-antigen ligase